MNMRAKMNTVEDEGLLGIFRLGLISLTLGFLMNLGHQTLTMFYRSPRALLSQLEVIATGSL
jgi:hypothetical protein